MTTPADDDARPAGLDADFVAGVVDHMNEDHADAVLAIVRHFAPADSGAGQASAAVMTGMDEHGLTARWTGVGGDGEVCVPLLRPVRDAAQVRGILISMTRRAREHSNDG